MLFSVALRRAGRVLVLCLTATLVNACSSSNGVQNDAATPQVVSPNNLNADPTIAIDAPHTLKVSVSGDGYVSDTSGAFNCGSGGNKCSIEGEPGSEVKLIAAAHFGSRMAQWNDTHTASINHTTLIGEHAVIGATFEKIHEIPDATLACNQPATPNFRALHLGDSLTAGFQVRFASDEESPLFNALAEYSARFDPQAAKPVTIAGIARRITGETLGDRASSSEPVPLAENHYWQQQLNARSLSVTDFNVAVVALGSNDVTDIIAGLSADDVVEQRIRPLLAWLGDRPVYWILPHYSRWPIELRGVQFSATSDGFNCDCKSAPGYNSSSPATGCAVRNVLEACNSAPDLIVQTETAFHAVYELRLRLQQLQYEYPNLIVVDPATTIVNASANNYDLYATMAQRFDSIHFSLQATNWFEWLHAYLANHANPTCNLLLEQWQMTEQEHQMGEAVWLDVQSQSDLMQ